MGWAGNVTEPGWHDWKEISVGDSQFNAWGKCIFLFKQVLFFLLSSVVLSTACIKLLQYLGRVILKPGLICKCENMVS